MDRKMFARFRALSLCLFLFFVLLPQISHAFWIWTPKDKRPINPKFAVKDTPQEQFRWAMRFYKEKDFQRAADEFVRLVDSYRDAEEAPEAQFYAGRSYEELGKYYFAFENYQKTVERYPYTKRLDEILGREFNLAEIFRAKSSPKLADIELNDSLEKAVEIYKKVVDNSPFSEYADKSLFYMAECYRRSRKYAEAVEAYEKLLSDYPSSSLVEEAKYQMADTTYEASLDMEYDQEGTRKALERFEEITKTTAVPTVAKEAEKVIDTLKSRKAESDYKIAQFYERQGKFKSAMIYYESILGDYPGTDAAKKAELRMKEIEPRAYPERKKEEEKRRKEEEAALREERKRKEEEEKKLKEEAAKKEEEEKAEEEAAEEEKEEALVPPRPEAARPAEAKPPKKEFTIFGYSASAMLPPDQDSIYVQSFANKLDPVREISDRRSGYTYRPGLEVEITRAVIDGFVFDRHLDVDSEKSAKLLLVGEVVDIRLEPLSYSSGDDVEEYRMEIHVNLELYDNKTGELIWKESNFMGQTEYDVSGQNKLTDAQAQAAVVNDLAKRIVERVVEYW